MNISHGIEIITLKSELNMIERHARALTASVFLDHDELYDELFLHTGIVISSLTKVDDLIRALRFSIDECHVAARVATQRLARLAQKSHAGLPQG